jgi:ribosomal protein S4
MQYFLMHLEQRLDVVFFRLRFLPTIVACHHFIKNNGVLVNNNIITYPYTKIKSNDIISVSKNF